MSTTTIYLVNAISLNMLNVTRETKLLIMPLSQDDVVKRLTIKSDEVTIVHAIGHQSTADLLTGLLGMEIMYSRANVKLGETDRLIIAQYTGPRLDEGTTILPEGAKVEFYEATLCY